MSPALLVRLLTQPGPESPLTILAMRPLDERLDDVSLRPEPDEARIVEPRHTPLGRREFTVIGPVGRALGGLWLDESILTADDFAYLAGLVERARKRARNPYAAPEGAPAPLRIIR
jgi:hypothetical protein